MFFFVKFFIIRFENEEKTQRNLFEFYPLVIRRKRNLK
jgi:hypothetical protein